jgi:putative ABC transport system permease protein
MLEADEAEVTVEINGQRATVAGIADDFGSFIGQPYVFTNYTEAGRYLRLRPETVQFLNVQLAAGADAHAVRDALQKRIPEVDVWLTKKFARRAQLYWVVQTGSGSAILTAAILGLVIGIVIVSQTTYATTMEHLDEFATLKALGASRWYIRGVVLVQTGISGIIGACIGLLFAYPLVAAARGSISWIFTPWWLPPSMIGVSLFMCCIAAIASVRKAVSVEPGRVFRA